MTIPETLKIGGHTYKVVVGAVPDSLKALYADTECGLCDVANCVIYINGNQTPSQCEESLIHEVLHAVNGTLEHDLLHSLAHSIHQVLSDNGLLK